LILALANVTQHCTPKRFACESEPRVGGAQGNFEGFGDLWPPHTLELEQCEDCALVQIHRRQGSLEELQIVTAFEQRRGVRAPIRQLFQEGRIGYFATHVRSTPPIPRGMQTD